MIGMALLTDGLEPSFICLWAIWRAFWGKWFLKSFPHLLKIRLSALGFFFSFPLLISESLLFWIQVFCWYDLKLAKLKVKGTVLYKTAPASDTSSGSPGPPSLLSSWLLQVQESP